MTGSFPSNDKRGKKSPRASLAYEWEGLWLAGLEQCKVGSWAGDPEGAVSREPDCDSFNKVN